jgi:DNA-binding CsgD family transcriptional regulator
VAIYSAITLSRGDRRSLHALIALDTLAALLLLAVFTGTEFADFYIGYVFVMVEAWIITGGRGLCMALAGYLIGLIGLQAARIQILGGAAPVTELLMWMMVLILVLGAFLAVDFVHTALAQPRRPVEMDRADGHGSVANPGPPPRRPEVQLSRRQIEILRLVAAGMSNAMIADQLHVSENTVKTHVRNIFLTLEAHSKAEAVARAARVGLLDDLIPS